MNAPVGPPICTREPPNTEITSPAMIAVTIPDAGLMPLAIANAIASGSASTPTVKPATTSVPRRDPLYPSRLSSSRGRKRVQAAIAAT